jgi:hypothetical protein
MKFQLYIGMLASIVVATSASAEVTDSATGGFTTVNELVIAADRTVVWQQAVDEVGLWWSSDHTVSGDASRLSISAVPQGCFCESFGEGAGVVHMTVTMVNPRVVLRLTGGLGPLGLMGVDGNMTWEFESVEGGTKVRFTYAVGGYRAGGLEEMAGPVDFVINEALTRLQQHVEAGVVDSPDLD